VVALLLVAVSLGLSNFAAAIGIGVTGVDGRTRLRVGLTFGLFEAGMPVLGLVLGHGVAGVMGHAARWAAAGLLIVTGGYAVVQARRDGTGRPAAPAAPPRRGRLAVTGLALSIDNLAAGFALGAFRVPVLLAAVLIGAVSAAMSLAGLELGARAGGAAGARSEVLGGAILMGVGAAIAAGVL
jgi:manganese efflux pump family protein